MRERTRRPERSGRSAFVTGMTLEALLFDLWGTLVVDNPQREGARRAELRLRLLREALASSGLSYSEEAIGEALPAFLKEHEALHAGGRDISAPEKAELFLESMEPRLARRLPPETLRAVEEALVSPGRLTPPLPALGAREVLEEAQGRGLALGLVSNTGVTPGYVLRDVLAGHGLLPYFRILTFSDEARLAKPSPQVYRCTLEALGADPRRAVFIGDHPRLDVAGPQAVGMWTVQVGDQQLDGVRPHARIPALSELFAALQRLGLLARWPVGV